MIESKVIEILGLEGRTGIIDAYKHKKSQYFFRAMKTLMEHHNFSFLFYISLKFVFFIQIFLEFLSFPLEYNDVTMQLSNFFAQLFLFDRLITDQTSFINIFNGLYVFTIMYMMLIVYLIVYCRQIKFIMPIKLLAFLNFILADMLFIPFLNILMKILNCKNSVHVYLNVACYTNETHLIYLFFSLIVLAFYLLVNFIFSYYMNNIKNIHDSTTPARVNCNYELFSKLSKILFFMSVNFVKNLSVTESQTNYILMKIIILIISIIMLIYANKKLYFFEPLYNKITFNGWHLLIWSSSVSLVKSIFNLNETTIFHVIGWTVILSIAQLQASDNHSELLDDMNIFNLNSLKELVCFNEKILSYCTTSKNYKAIYKGTAITLATSFEEILENEEELNVNHQKFVFDSHVKAKFKNKNDLILLSMVNIVYDYYLHMRKTKDDLSEENVFLHFCYFLITNLKNNVYCAFLCTKVKITSHKNQFLNFMLIEFVKEKLKFQLNKHDKAETIKQIQIGTLLAYEYYLGVFFTKIHEEVTKQCDYFSIFKKDMNLKEDKGGEQSIVSNFKVHNLLSMGEEIMQIKKDIEKAYKQILLIYPTVQIKNRFYFYLNLVLDDDDKLRIEDKVFAERNQEYVNDKGPIYKSLFEPNSCIIIVDGYVNIGGLLYNTPNFTKMFNLEGLQTSTMTVHDLVPVAIEHFHYKIVMNGIKYSNLSTIFNKQRTLFVRGTHGNVNLGKVFVRNIPDLTNGLNYIISIIKVEETQTSSSIILDSNFIINGMTNLHLFDMEQSNLNLTNIVFFIPNIFLHIKWSQDLGYYFDEANEEHMGVFYKLLLGRPEKKRLMEARVEKLLFKIKTDSKLKSFTEDEDLIWLINNMELQSEFTFIVCYKSVTRSFVNHTHKYHQVFVNKIDLNVKNELSTNLTETLIKTTNKNDEDKEAQNLDFFKNNFHQDSVNLVSVFSCGAHSSSTSSTVIMSLKEKLYNINSSKRKLMKNKGEISQIKFMKIICLFFCIISITLSIISEQIIKSNFISINQFVIDNLFFNKTKLVFSCVYASVINLQSDNGFYSNKTEISQRMLEYINYQHLSSVTAITFAKDLKNLLNNNLTIILETGNGQFVISIEDFINLVLAMTLKITTESDLNKQSTPFDKILANDLINLSDQFLSNDTIKGYDMQYELDKFQYTNYFLYINIIFSISIALILFIIILFLYLSFRVLKWEKKLLMMAKNLKAPLFVKYLSTLLEIKKSYNSGNKDDNDRDLLNEEEEEGEEDLNKKASNKTLLSQENNKHDKNTELHGDPKNKNKKKVDDNNNNKKKKTDMTFSKIESSFSKNCLKTVLQIMIVLILSLLYYVVTIVLINANVNSTLNFHKITNALEFYFQTNFMNFFSIKNTIANFQDNTVLSFNDPTILSLGSQLFEVKYYFASDNPSILILNSLINGNACQVIQIPGCEAYMNGILTRGLDQSIVQTNLLMSNFIKDSANRLSNITSIYQPGSFFVNYEQFIMVYLYQSYKVFSSTITDLKNVFITGLIQNLYSLQYFFLGLWAISFFVLLYIINKMRRLFFSLILFFHIIPSKHILEDNVLTNAIIKLKKKM